MALVEITADNFESEVAESDLPVIIDLWAPWCGPCKSLTPVIEKLAGEYEGQIKVGKVNVDEQPELAQAFRVQGIPMIVALKGRDVTGHQQGFRGEAAVRQLFEETAES
ncbi:MAG: thioredoxin [Persicimonas sp.]